MSAYPVSKPLWESLEAVMMAHAKKLAKDVAKQLRQPEQPLLQAIQKERIPLYLVEMTDPTDEEFYCKAMDTTKSIAHICRKPVLYGSLYCPEHSVHPQKGSSLFEQLPKLHRFITEEGEIYYYDELLRNVYDSHSKFCGVLSREDPPVFHKIVISDE
jgi:hypothetical protein